MAIEREQVDAFSLSIPSGTMAAGLGAAAPIVAIRWAKVGSLMVIDSFRIAVAGVASFTAGTAKFSLSRARAYTVADTDGTTVAWTIAGSNKKRITSANSAFATTGEIRMSTTATITAGTRTLDTNAQGSIVCPVPTGAAAWTLATTELLPACGYPLVLSAVAAASVEGLILHATVPANGTWIFTLDLHWREFTTAAYDGV